MTTFVYINEQENERRGDQKDRLVSYVNSEIGSDFKFVMDAQPLNIHWESRPIGEVLNNTMKAGDELVVFDAIHLARSTSQLLELLHTCSRSGIKLHFVKYNRSFSAQEPCKTLDLLGLMKDIESDFVSRRTTDALARRRAAGLPLGRPKGRKNKSLKLDKHHADIIKYLELGISKASIAKLVRCHPQTLYDWLERKSILTDAGAVKAEHRVVEENA